MPKKRVGVSLRKPSPAPETIPESVVAHPGTAAAGAPASEAALDGAPSAVVMSGEAATSERPSDIVALREAAAAPAAAKAIDAFVNGAAAAIDRAAAAIPSARLAAVLQRGFEGYRELVLYLPEKLAERLSLHCLEHNLDMSHVVASAIEQHLNGATSPAAADAGRANDAPSNDGLLSLAARLLMGELAAWARAVWVRRRSPAASRRAAAVG